MRRGFSDVGGVVEELERRLAAIEAQLLGLSDLSVSLQCERSHEHPTVVATSDRAIRP